MGPSGQAPTFHTYEIPQIPFHTHAGRSKVFKNWDGSDGRVVPQPTNPSKFRRDFASGKSHSAPLPHLLLSIHIRRLKAPPCIHSIPFLLLHSFHSSIHWLTQSILVLHFHLGKSNQNMEFLLRQNALLSNTIL